MRVYRALRPWPLLVSRRPRPLPAGSHCGGWDTDTDTGGELLLHLPTPQHNYGCSGGWEGSVKARVRRREFLPLHKKTCYRRILLPDSASSHQGKLHPKGEEHGLGDTIRSLHTGVTGDTRVKEIQE